jgi:vancomycin permeability regulator SanA
MTSINGELAAVPAIERASAVRSIGPRTAGIARGLAGFLGTFSLLNILGEFYIPGFDANIWWIDFQPLPASARRLLLGIAALALIGFALRPKISTTRLRITIALLALALIFVLGNIVQFYLLLAESRLGADFPVPFSLFIGVALVAIMYGLNRSDRVAGRKVTASAAITFVLCMILFPLMQIFCFGKTDYRRPADAAVVFGAKAYADGRPSIVLADRVRTACELYRMGLVHTLIFSGGPGDGAVHETESMRRFALKLGVPDSAIVRDEFGLSTQETCANSEAIFRRMGIRRVLAVSNFYHLPRIKMTYQRERREVYTVPAEETYMFSTTPFQIAREVLALWAYYLGALWW